MQTKHLQRRATIFIYCWEPNLSFRINNSSSLTRVSDSYLMRANQGRNLQWPKSGTRSSMIGEVQALYPILTSLTPLCPCRTCSRAWPTAEEQREQGHRRVLGTFSALNHWCFARGLKAQLIYLVPFLPPSDPAPVSLGTLTQVCEGPPPVV